MPNVTTQELTEFANHMDNTMNTTFENHILQLRSLTKKAKQLEELLNTTVDIADIRRQHIVILRNILKHIDQHLKQPRERNTPVLISAIQRALEITAMYEKTDEETKGE